jgi:hypothetical protein
MQPKPRADTCVKPCEPSAMRGAVDFEVLVFMRVP